MIRRVMVIALVALVLLTVVWYAALDRPENTRLKNLDNEQAQVASKVSGLQLQLMALQAQERHARRPIAQPCRRWSRLSPTGPALTSS